MKNYLAINQQILKEWGDEFERRGHDRNLFSEDGIMYKGVIRRDMCNHWVRHPSDPVTFEKENKLWDAAPLRILFLSKEQYIGDQAAYESNMTSFHNERAELEDNRLTSVIFLRRMAWSLYGLSKSTPSAVVPFDDVYGHDTEVLQCVDELPFAWINCKKEGGGAACSNAALIDAMNEYKDYLVKQIRNVDADIIICCGHKEGLKNSTGNLILDFLKNNMFNLEYAGNDYQDLWYDKVTNKLAIDSWHPSARVSHEAFYHYIVETYQRFIHDHPSFAESHRVGE